MNEISSPDVQIIQAHKGTSEPLQITPEGFVNAPIPNKAIVNEFKLSPEVNVFLVMKSRKYTDKDGMLVVLREKSEKHIESIADLQPKEIHELLRLAEKASEVGSGEDDFQFIAINTHDSNGYGYAQELNGRKLVAQTLRDLHVHFGVISPDWIKPIDKPLSRGEKDNVFDPMTKVIERLLSVPSIKKTLFDGLPFTFEGMRKGNLCFSKIDLSDAEISAGLILLQNRLKNLYEEIISCFYSDPTVLEDGQIRRRKIGEFFEKMRKEPENIDTTDTIEKLERFFYWLNENLKEQPSEDDRMFLKGFAATTVFVKKHGEEGWDFLIAPRVISVGNALDAFGLIKRLIEPDPDFRIKRKEYIDQLRALKV